MLRTPHLLRSLLLILITTVARSTQFLRLALSSRTTLSAEVLFLRKQLAFYQEHQIHPRKLTAAARFSLVLWSRFFNWRHLPLPLRSCLNHGGQILSRYSAPRDTESDASA